MNLRTILAAFGLLCTSYLFGQEINFSQIQNLKSYYNPSVISEERTILSACFRNVSYQQVSVIRSGALVGELQFLKKDSSFNSGHFKINFGLLFDKTNQNVLSTTKMALGFGYDLPLNRRSTLSLAFQASNFSSNLNLANATVLPDNTVSSSIGAQLPSATSLQNLSLNRTGLNVGVTYKLKTSKLGDFMIGYSLRNFNRPNIKLYSSETFRVPAISSVQGYYLLHKPKYDYSFSSVFDYSNEAYEYLMVGEVVRKVSTNQFKNLGVGLDFGYRLKTSLLAGLSVQSNKWKMSFFYDININTIVTRNAYELGLKYAL